MAGLAVGKHSSVLPAHNGFVPDLSRCPCGLGQPYLECCGRFHAGTEAAPTAELLMRSRFSAFAVQDDAYLLRTWHPRTRPPHVRFDARQRWTGLEIVDRSGGLFDREATVEFRATYTLGGRPGTVHERSQFSRHENSWMYVGAVVAR
jgi:SEC-C motif-containing protein